MTTRLSTFWPLFSAFACASQPQAPSHAVAAVLDSLAPGVRIGARAAPTAERLHLAFAPYAGYADSAFQDLPGSRGIVLWVNEDLNSEGQEPSRWARIAEVGVKFVTKAGADSAKELLIRHLGQPRRFCVRAEASHRPEVALYFWPDHPPQGVLFRVPLEPPEPAFVIFEALQPDSNISALSTCDAA
jgi:hypothetical protein